MRWPIRNQILVPFTAVLLAAVAVTSVTSSYLAARRAERDILAQLNRMIETLSPSSFPWSLNVLETMKGLSGAEFLLFDEGDRPSLTTAPASTRLPETPPDALQAGPLSSLAETPVVAVGERRYFAGGVRRTSAFHVSSTLLVLFPVERWARERAEAAKPPLIVGAMTLVVLTIVAAWLAARFGARLRRVEQQVAEIAGGKFLEVPVESRRDEIRDLAVSVNLMSQKLREQQRMIGRTERTRLLGQLAGGLAHQLRNAATGARMAVQIHLRRCSVGPADNSLETALRQLSLMEEQVRGLLSLGKTERRPQVDGRMGDFLSEVSALVAPACQHRCIEWELVNETPEDAVITDVEGLRTAIVNLALNAIEAASEGGRVGLRVGYNDGRWTFDVNDTGPGPPPEIADHLFELFVTEKPEGVGFGLALARQVAKERGGTIAWHRANDRTHFCLEIPAAARTAGTTSIENLQGVSAP